MARTKARRGRPTKSQRHSSPCGKLIYSSRRSALAAAELQGEKHSAGFRVYGCRRCNGWHLSTKT